MGAIIKKNYVNAQPQHIEKYGPVTVESSIYVPEEEGVIHKLSVTVNIKHSYTADLSIFLVRPGSPETTVQLVSRKGGGGAHFEGTTFDDDATWGIAEGNPPFKGVFRPEENLDRFQGESNGGAWRLRIVDQAAEDGGDLKGWSLYMELDTQGELTYDVEMLKLMMRRVEAIQAAKDVMRLSRCIQSNGGTIEGLLDCIDPKPKIKLPSIIEELVLQFPEEEQAYFGAKVLAAEERLMGQYVREILELDYGPDAVVADPVDVVNDPVG